MIRERTALILRLYKALDLLIVGISYILAYFLARWMAMGNLPPLSNYLWLLIVIIPLWGLLLFTNQVYFSQRGKAFSIILLNVTKANVEGFLCLVLIYFVFGPADFDKNLIFSFIAISTCLLIIEKAIVLNALKYLRKRGRNIKYILVVGAGDRARRFINNVNQHMEAGIKVIGCLDIDPAKIGNKIEGVKIVGTSDQLSSILHTMVIDDVVFALPLSRSFLEQIRGYLIICQEMGINGRILTDFYYYREFFDGKIFIDELMGVPLISFSTGPNKLAHLYIKYFLDLMIALTAVILVCPLMIVIALAIKLTSSGPIIFKQERSGVNGRVFTLYKFRTMFDGADKQKEMLKNLNEMSGPVFKLTNDPRITPIGKILRSSSLDELPQLFNVLEGDMSLVGPRPLPVQEAANISGPNRRRLSVKPGITCTWQVNGRNNIDFEQWMELDLEYIDNWSLMLDFKTLLRTIPAVIIGRGAK